MERDALRVARVPRSTWQNWVFKGVNVDPIDGLWHLRHLFLLVLATVLIEDLGLPTTVQIWPSVEALNPRWSTHEPGSGPWSLVIDAHTLDPVITEGGDQLAAAVSQAKPFVRAYKVFSLDALLDDSARAFGVSAVPATILAEDRRRRASNRPS